MLVLDTEGLPGASITIVGVDAGASRHVLVPTDNLREVRVLVTVPREGLATLTADSMPFSLVLRDAENNSSSTRRTQFQTQQGSRP